MAFARIPLLLAFLYTAVAKQPSAPSAVPAPLRELPWGQLNFLHTTDTHGWHAGHLQEAQYSADWGDYVSFAYHLHGRADSDGSDLLLVDTGDRIEGNGLYDASDPKGKYTLQIFPKQAIDIVTIGNHELYKRSASEREFKHLVPAFKDSYIASNLNIYDPKSGELVPMASRFRKFTTKNQGIRILAFGFLFNFKGNANNTVVQPVEETIKEQWFQDAIRSEDVDLIVVTGHVPVRDSPEFPAIYKAIRAVQWDTPIVFFGGHTHIRDYARYEKKAFGLESGRYMETLGFLSITGLKTGKKDKLVTEASPTYKRLYIDNNLHSLHQHSGKNESNFDTELGLNVSKAITDARQDLKLDHAFGCAPKDLWLNRAPFPSADSLLTWLEKIVIPDTFNADSKSPAIVITNTGAIRFDIFKGPFTSDTRFLVSPFTSGFRMLKDVPYAVASKVLPLLNNEGPILLKDLISLTSEQDGVNVPKLDRLLPALPPVNRRSLQQSGSEFPTLHMPFENEQQKVMLSNDKDSDEPKIPGYTTSDDAGKDGDDTVHQVIKFFDVPNCIASNIGFTDASQGARVDTPDKVDLVYNAFIENWIILALRFLGETRETKDTSAALDGKTMTDVISDWVGANWKCPKN